MQVHLSIGENHRFELHEALLIYRDRQSSFITRHDVTARKDTPPTLGPAQPLTVAFIESLTRSLSGSLQAEVLPANVLAKSEHDCLVDSCTAPPDVLRELRRQGRGVEWLYLPATSIGLAGLEWRTKHSRAHRKQAARWRNETRRRAFLESLG
jgi:hypothetical protein